MILKINSTRGHTGSLLVTYYGHSSILSSGECPEPQIYALIPNESLQT